jgi:hypothetical protein
MVQRVVVDLTEQHVARAARTLERVDRQAALDPAPLLLGPREAALLPSKPVLTVGFSDMWEGFDPADNFFLDLASTRIKLITDFLPSFG